MGLKHLFHSAKADPADPTIIGATKWNADHYYVDGAGAPIGNVGALLLAGAAGALTHLNSVAAGSVLTSAGAGVPPVWAAATAVVTSVVLKAGTPAAHLSAPADGKMLLQNVAENDFSLLQFGGTTNAFPALKRSGVTLQVRYADDSALGYLQAEDVKASSFQLAGGAIYLLDYDHIIQSGNGSPNGVYVAAVGSLFLRRDGGAATTLYIKETGTGNTGWVAK